MGYAPINFKPPPWGNPRAFECSLCPGGGEFEPCWFEPDAWVVGKLEPIVKSF